MSTEERRRRRDRMRTIIAVVTLVAVLGGVVLAGTSAIWTGGGNDPAPADGADVASCPAPTSAGLSALVAGSDLVLEGDVARVVTLTDGVNTTDAWEMDVPETGAIAVWPSVEITQVPTGRLVVFLVKHPGTTVDGKAVDGYDVAGAGGVLTVEGSSLHRICGTAKSAAADRSVLDQLRRA